MVNTYTSIVTPKVAITVFLVILIICFIIALRCNPKDFDYTRTKIYISCLAGFGIFITFLFYYSIVSLQQAQQRIDIITMTRNLNAQLMKGVIEQIQTASEKIPQFTSSLFPLLDVPPTKNPDENTIENGILKFKIAYKIFALWQEYLLSAPFIDLDQLAIICNFLQKANSKLLYEQWDRIKIDFNQKTQEFSQLLFNYSQKITNQTPETYVETAKIFIQDPKYKSILYD